MGLTSKQMKELGVTEEDLSRLTAEERRVYDYNDFKRVKTTQKAIKNGDLSSIIRNFNATDPLLLGINNNSIASGHGDIIGCKKDNNFEEDFKGDDDQLILNDPKIMGIVDNSYGAGSSDRIKSLIKDYGVSFDLAVKLVNSKFTDNEIDTLKQGLGSVGVELKDVLKYSNPMFPPEMVVEKVFRKNFVNYVNNNPESDLSMYIKKLHNDVNSASSKELLESIVEKVIDESVEEDSFELNLSKDVNYSKRDIIKHFYGISSDYNSKDPSNEIISKKLKVDKKLKKVLEPFFGVFLKTYDPQHGESGLYDISTLLDSSKISRLREDKEINELMERLSSENPFSRYMSK